MIRITQGEPIVLATTVLQNNLPVAVGDWEIRAAVRRTADSQSSILDGTVSINDNVVTATFSNTTTLDPGTYVVSIRFNQPSGIKRTLNYDLTVREDVNW